MRDSKFEMQHNQGRFRRAAQDAGMRNDNRKAGGVRGEEYFWGAGLKVGGGGGVSRASRKGLMGTRISGLPKIGATGRKRSLGKSLREVRKLRGKLNEPSFTSIPKEGPSSVPKDVLKSGSGQAQRCPYAPVARLRMADDTAEVRAPRRSFTQQGR
jgi:hypothetical protein